MAGGVPNLKFNRGLPVNFHNESPEFNTDCDLMVILKYPLRERLHEAALADTRVTYDNNFK